MKTIKNILIVTFPLLISSCNILDIDESTGTTKEGVFQVVERTKQMLTHIYSYLPSDFNSIDGTSRSCATDDAEYVWENSNIRFINDGTWSPMKLVDANWDYYYEAIRASNQLLENFNEYILDKYQYETNYEDLKAQFLNHRYEAKFLRAFYHFELAKRYGDIPLVTRVYDQEEVNSIGRNAFMEVIDFIVRECDEVITELPVSYLNMPGVQETGRVTKGAAMALKTRALLYAASPLHNENSDNELWKRAALSAKVLIDSAEIKGWYSLPNNSFDYNVISSKELIFESREAGSNYFEKANFPIGFEGGNTGICPTQNLVDAFEMTAAVGGGKFDWNNPLHSKDPYLNRDPRLARTIITDKSSFKGVVVDISRNGANGLPQDGASKTGYYLRKFIIETINLTPSNTTTAIHYWPIFRYADILLSYAEAMNEAFPNSTTYSDEEFVYSAEWALNKVRSRAKIKPISGLSYDQFKEALINERRVELAFEDHRFWDIRRWRIADKTVDIYATKITNEDGMHVYEPNALLTRRFWNDRMYLYPIPANEVFNNASLNQNPNW